MAKTPDGFMNISNIDPNEGKAYGIRKFITKDNQVQEVRYAEKAEYVNDATANVFDVSFVTFLTNTLNILVLRKMFIKLSGLTPYQYL